MANSKISTFWVLTASALLALSACGGGDPQGATVPVGAPHAVLKAGKPTGAAAVAVHLYQALYGKAPSYALMTDYTAQATANAATFASSLASAFASTSHAALAKLVLDNLGVTATTVTAVNSKNESEYAILLDAVQQIFAAYPTMRGQVILNMTNLLDGLEADVTYGGAAVAYNNQASANHTYATNAANTSPAAVSAAGVGGTGVALAPLVISSATPGTLNGTLNKTGAVIESNSSNGAMTTYNATDSHCRVGAYNLVDSGNSTAYLVELSFDKATKAVGLVKFGNDSTFATLASATGPVVGVSIDVANRRIGFSNVTLSGPGTAVTLNGSLEYPANVDAANQAACGGAAAPAVASSFVVRTNPTGATTKAPTHVVWTGSKFVGLEQSTDFHNAAAKFFSWTSADGISWTRNTTDMVSDYPNMTAANGLAFQLPGAVTGSPFTIKSSGDGITWVASTASYTGSAVPRSVKYLNGKYFISMDVDTCTVISSTNASTWTSTDLRALALPTGYTKRINTTYCSEPIYLDGQYLVYGGAIEFYVKNATSLLTQGLVYSSTDGTNWTASGFALPTGVNSIPQGGRSRTVLQIGNTVVIPTVHTDTQVRIKPTDPYPTQVITNEQVGTSTDGLNFTYAPATGIAANANTLAFYPSLPLPGGMLATTSASTLVNFQSVFTYSYYYTTNGVAYTAAPDMKVGEGGYNAAPFAYSPSLKRLVFIKQETTNFAPSGVTLSTYDVP